MHPAPSTLLFLEWYHPAIFGKYIDNAQDKFISLVPGKVTHIKKVARPGLIHTTHRYTAFMKLASNWFVNPSASSSVQRTFFFNTQAESNFCTDYGSDDAVVQAFACGRVGYGVKRG